MSVKKYYSLRDLSQELNIPKSTIVKYKDYFPDFFKLYGEGKRKKFQEESLEILRAIREMREEQKLDWLDIKDILAERFAGNMEEAVEESAETAVVPASAAPSPGDSKRLEHLSHLFNALAFEIMNISGQSRQLQCRQDAQAAKLVKIETGLLRLNHAVELVLLDIMRRDGDTKKLMRDQMTEIRGQFSQVRKDMNALATGINAVAKSRQPALNADAILKLTEKIDRAAAAPQQDGMQNKYQLLLKENKLLKDRLRELDARPSSEPPPRPPRKTILGKMFKSQARD